MVLLGIQFVITLAVALFLQKLSPFYSLARWIMCTKLYRYLHPSNEQLKALVGKPIVTTRGKRRKVEKCDNNNHQLDTFTVPCNIDINLDCAGIEEVDLFSQYKYQDFKWLIDFSACAVFVYILIEIVGLWRPQVYVNEFNIGFVWCCMVVFFCLKELFSLTSAYWRCEDGGERSMTLSFGLFFFVAAMGVLIIDESITDFGLEEGFKHFSQHLQLIYKRMNLNVDAAPSVWAFKILLAIVSAFLGAVLGFPGIRYANMHIESFYYSTNRYVHVLLYVTFFSPVLLSLLWITPLSRDLLLVKDPQSNATRKLITDEVFLYLRIHLVIAICVFRLLVTRRLLQSHLNSAYQKIANIKKETGRVTNLELQRTVARVFYYLSTAALQYTAPLIFVLFLAMMLRTLTYHMVDTKYSAGDTSSEREEYARLIRGLFSVKLVNSVFSYLTWWSLNVYFMTSCFGAVYLKLKY